MQKLLFLACTLLCIVSAANAKEKNSTEPNSDPNSNYITALKQKAELGDPNSQNTLGKIYANGQGVRKDYKQAVYWFRKAANQKHVKALYNLGYCYESNQGVRQNYNQAFLLYRMAANQDFAPAQFKCGICYYEGKGTRKNYEKAVYWWQKAAEHEIVEAYLNLAVCYRNGQGVKRNSNQGFYWTNKAAELGDSDSEFYLGLCYYLGEGVDKNYNQAINWFLKSAKQGNAQAQLKLAFCYAKGQGVLENFIEAYKWCLLASKNGEDVSEIKNLLRFKLNDDDIKLAKQRAQNFIAQQKVKDTFEGTSIPEIPEKLESRGTAFCIHSDGYFITSNHIITQQVESIKIRTEKGLISAKVVSSDEGLDIALLKVDTNDLTAIPIISSSSMKTGQKVFTIGFPNVDIQGSEPKFTEGVISSLSGIQNNPRFFQIAVAVQPGNSGGPLVDEKGRVVGIVTAKLDDITSLIATGSVPQNVNYAVKSSFVLPIFEGIEGLKELPKATELSREEAIQKVKAAVGLVQCYKTE